MKIQFLESSSQGLRWMKRYYENNPQLDRKKASMHFLQTQSLLQQQPFLGHPYEDYSDIRELNISESSFSILYTSKRNTIFIIDIRDQKGLRSGIVLKEFNLVLRKKYNL